MKLEEMKRAVVEAIVGSKHVQQLDIFGERDASMVDRIMTGFQIVETAYFQRIALLDPNATLPLNKEKIIGQFVIEFTLGGSQVNGETLIDLWKETCAQFKANANDIKKIGKEILSLIEKFNTDKGTHEMVDKMKAMHAKEPHWVNFQKELPEFKWVVLSEKYSIADVLDYLIAINEVNSLDRGRSMSKYIRILDFIYQIPNNQAPGVLEYFNIPTLPVKTPEKIGEEIEFAINLKLVQQLTIDKPATQEGSVKPKCNCGKIGCPSNNEDADFINIRQQLMSTADFPALLKIITQQTEPKPLIIDLGSTDGTDLRQMVEDIRESLFNPKVETPKIKLDIGGKPVVDFDKLINLWLDYITKGPAVESVEEFSDVREKFHNYMENQTEENMNEALLALRSKLNIGKDTLPINSDPSDVSMLGDIIFQHGGLDYPLPGVGAGKQSAIEYFIGLDFNRGKPTSEDPLNAGLQQQVDRYKQNRLSRGSYFFEELFTGKEPAGNGRLSPRQILDTLFGEKKPKATQISSSSHTVLNQNFIVYDVNGDFSCEYKMIWTNSKVRIMYTHTPPTVGESRQFRHVVHNHDCTEQEAINIFASLRESMLN